MKAYPFYNIIFIIAILSFSFVGNAGQKIEQKIPSFNVKELQGNQTLTQENFKGKPAIINFFASWCSGCKIEHNLLMQLARNNITIHGINTDDTPSEALRMIRHLGNPYTVLAHDAYGHIGNIFGISGLPVSFVIDKFGVVKYRHEGALTGDAVRGVIIPLMQSLNE